MLLTCVLCVCDLLAFGWVCVRKCVCVWWSSGFRAGCHFQRDRSGLVAAADRGRAAAAQRDKCPAGAQELYTVHMLP
jgi:hypothetical protein